MVDWGIGPEAHVRAATTQTHPFSRDPTSELDLQFVPDAASLMRAVIACACYAHCPFVSGSRQAPFRAAPFEAPRRVWPQADVLRFSDPPAQVARYGSSRQATFEFELAGELNPSTVRLPIARKSPGAGAPPSDSVTRLGPSAADFANELESDTK